MARPDESMRWDWRRRACAALALVLAGLTGGCSKPAPKTFAADPYYVTARTLVRLDSMEVTLLGELEGPFYLVEAVTPTLVKMSNPDGEIREYRLLGLMEGEYEPAEKKNEPVDKKTEARREARRQEVTAFKEKALQELCGVDRLWMLRMSQETPPAIYLFKLQASDPANKQEPPRGLADLVNALLVRRGLANMDIQMGIHPFYPVMLDCQLAAMVESRRNQKAGKPADDLWSRFHMSFPLPELDKRLAEIESKMPSS